MNGYHIMNSKQRRKKRRAASKNNNLEIPPDFNLVDVTNQLYKFSERLEISLSTILCGYGRAPIYSKIEDETHIELLHICAMRPNYVCRYNSPQKTWITDSCDFYKSKFKNTKV